MKAAPTVADCPPPDTAAMLVAGPAVLVSENEAGVETPVTLAVTEYVPETVSAVMGTLASPLAPVIAVVPEGNVTPAPVPGPAKVIVTPETGLPYWSSTTATRELVKAVPTVADCPPPEATVIVFAGPVTLVREYEAGVETPLTLAVAA